ncbi:LuxR C-terminal-related transcriptional regulator [Chitinophaga lutea]
MNHSTSNHRYLHAVWDEAPIIYTPSDIRVTDVSIHELVASLFCPGPHYYYLVDFSTREIKYMHENVRSVHGFDPGRTTFNDIINAVHPDDIPYVTQAEAAILQFMDGHFGSSSPARYAMSYSFRMRVASGDYELFHHQAILLSTDEKGFAQSVNIHTNIHHITTVNSYKATMMGILGEEGFFEIAVRPEGTPTPFSLRFSKREVEIIRLIAEGKKNDEIAAELFISSPTVKTHRRNILRKAEASTSAELIAICMREGLLAP